MECKKLRKMMSKFLATQKKIILSLSVISLIFLNSYWFSSFLSSLKLYFSAFQFHLLGIASNKNCIFLICNGLLVFVAKTFNDPVLSSSGFDLNELLQKKIGDSLPPTLETKEPSLSLIKDIEENEELKEENEAEEDEEEKCLLEEEKKPKNLVMEDLEDEDENEFGIGLLFDEPKEEEVVDECLREEEKKLANMVMEDLGGSGENCNIHDDENESKIGLLFDEEEEEEDDHDVDDDNMEMLSTEQLTKKFEDFIQRMKGDIRMGRNNYNYGQVNYNYDINLDDKNWPIIIVN